MSDTTKKTAAWKDDRLVAADGEVLDRVRYEPVTGEHVVVGSGKRYVNETYAKRAAERKHGVGDLSRPPGCRAEQHSDSMVCSCGLRWDVNDPVPPTCHREVVKAIANGIAGNG